MELSVPLSSLLAEIDGINASSAMSLRAAALKRVGDLFAQSAPRLSEHLTGVFDSIILRLADQIEQRALMLLAERLADIPNAPAATINQLARDTITVAKPLLERSQRLEPEDLIAISGACGRDHMLAIASRKGLTEAVTAFLVGAGDRVVVHAVSANHTARFANHTIASLIERARTDGILETTLRARRDIPEHLVSALLEVAKDTARQRLQKSEAITVDEGLKSIIDRSAIAVAGEAGIGEQAKRLASAASQVDELIARDALDEGVIAKFARKRMFEHCVCAIAAYCVVPMAAVMRAFLNGDRSALLISARAKNLSWQTVLLLLPLLNGAPPSQRQLDELARDFARFKADTASKILQFMLARDAARPPPAAQAARRAGDRRTGSRRSAARVF